MCLHGLLFNLIGLLGEKLCTEPLPVEGKLFYKRTSRHRHLSYLRHLLLSPSHSTESKRGTDFSVETISNTHPGVFFVGKLGQSCSSPEIKLDIQLSRVAALLLSVLFDLLTDSHNRAFSISKEEKKKGEKNWFKYYLIISFEWKFHKEPISPRETLILSFSFSLYIYIHRYKRIERRTRNIDFMNVGKSFIVTRCTHCYRHLL